MADRSASEPAGDPVDALADRDDLLAGVAAAAGFLSMGDSMVGSLPPGAAGVAAAAEATEEAVEAVMASVGVEESRTGRANTPCCGSH